MCVGVGGAKHDLRRGGRYSPAPLSLLTGGFPRSLAGDRHTQPAPLAAQCCIHSRCSDLSIQQTSLRPGARLPYQTPGNWGETWGGKGWLGALPRCSQGPHQGLCTGSPTSPTFDYLHISARGPPFLLPYPPGPLSTLCAEGAAPPGAHHVPHTSGYHHSFAVSSLITHPSTAASAVYKCYTSCSMFVGHSPCARPVVHSSGFPSGPSGSQVELNYPLHSSLFSPQPHTTRRRCRVLGSAS